MPKIATFMYAERTEPNPQGQMLITNPLLAINPMFVPGMFSFAIIVGVVGVDNQSDHTMRVTFLGPDKEEKPVIDTNIIQLPKGEAPEVITLQLPPEQRGMMFNLDFRNVVFKKEGLYTTHIYIDGDLLGEYPIFVKAGEPQ